MTPEDFQLYSSLTEQAAAFNAAVRMPAGMAVVTLATGLDPKQAWKAFEAEDVERLHDLADQLTDDIEQGFPASELSYSRKKLQSFYDANAHLAAFADVLEQVDHAAANAGVQW